MSGDDPAGAAGVERALREPRQAGEPSLVAFLTAGYPDRAGFADLLLQVASEADVVEVGVPFSDPMADGVTIQRASRVALEAGVSLAWILETLAGLKQPPQAPILLMSYLNPLLAYGLEGLVPALVRSGVSGLIVPDLPMEESDLLLAPLSAKGLALVQMVTPVTPPDRVERLCRASSGFVYAVTVTGITGGTTGGSDGLARYLDSVAKVSPLPVLAGFGIRSRDQIGALGSSTAGVIVGSALIEVLERGEDPVAFLRGLRGRGG